MDGAVTIRRAVGEALLVECGWADAGLAVGTEAPPCGDGPGDARLEVHPGISGSTASLKGTWLASGAAGGSAGRALDAADPSDEPSAKPGKPGSATLGTSTGTVRISCGEGLRATAGCERRSAAALVARSDDA